MYPPAPPTEAADLVQYLNEAWTPYHAVLASCRRLLAAGFQEIREVDSWTSDLSPGGRYFFTRNMSAVCAFAVGKKHKPGNGFVIIGAHTDSPCPRLKPKTNLKSNAFLQVRVQNYGGGLWYTWFDRDLGVAGRVLVKRKEGPSHELVRVTRPVMRISSLAIHLDRTTNDGFKVNFQQHMAPIIAREVDKALGAGGITMKGEDKDEDETDPKRTKTDAESKHCPVLLELLAEELRCDPRDVLDFELQLCDVQPSVIGGARNEFVFSGRLDNLQSCHASLCALINASTEMSLENETLTRMMVHYDHEEVGSDSAQGAGSAMTTDALRRITKALSQCDASTDLDERSRRESFLVSADMAHAVHPNYPDRHESGHAPRFGSGVVIKHNANQRYATDAVTGWLFRELGEKVGVPTQEFVVRSDLGCGSTIGPTLSTSTGIRTVDVGPPQLSMHSVREMCAVADVAHSIKHYQSVFENFGTLDKTLVVDGKIGHMCRPCD